MTEPTEGATTAPVTALPEKYRRMSSIREGYQVKTRDGWLTVTSQLHITAPIPVVRLEMEGGVVCATDPSARLMSRRLASKGGEPA